MRLIVATLLRFQRALSTGGISLELSLNKMDLEARIQMPEDRGPDTPAGPAHRLMSAKATDPSQKKSGFL
jgi:hypothetical protein